MWAVLKGSGGVLDNDHVQRFLAIILNILRVQVQPYVRALHKASRVLSQVQRMLALADTRACHVDLLYADTEQPG